MSSLTADPWNTNATQSTAPPGYSYDEAADEGEGPNSNAQPRVVSNGHERNASLASASMAQMSYSEWEKVSVTQKEEIQGKWLSHYHVYSVTRMSHGSPVIRRYSDFCWLNDYLLSRYPFRLISPLPPKRLALNGRHALVDSYFLERRRRGLQRYSEAISNHPQFKIDPVVQSFFTEPSGEVLRAMSVSKQEEVSDRPLSQAEESSVPTDLEDRLETFKSKLLHLVDLWTKICQSLEKTAKRRETASLEYSKLSDQFSSVSLLSVGLEEDNTTTSKHLARHAELIGTRQDTFGLSTLERAKMHRELYSGWRDLLVRHEKLAPDAVDKLRKRVVTSQNKIESVTSAAKPQWEVEVDNLNKKIGDDNATIEKLLKRRLYIRFCLWNELAWLNRCSTLLHDVLKELAIKERVYEEDLARNWQDMSTALEH